MPNHVHAIVRPLAGNSLEAITKSWKQYSSIRINRIRGTKGEIWQSEAFDRIIRDEEHLWRVIQYIGGNPIKAKLPKEEYSLWLRAEWDALGWKFEDR
jgi:putative transposase